MKIQQSYWRSQEIENKRRVESNIARLVQEYKYEVLSQELSEKVQQYYIDKLPKRFISALNLDDDFRGFPLYTIEGTQVTTSFFSICVGDYGAYVEILPRQILINNLIIPGEQLYRIDDPEYVNQVKYNWYTAKDNSHIKIYHQKKTVPYADYHPDWYYISVYDVFSLEAFE